MYFCINPYYNGIKHPINHYYQPYKKQILQTLCNVAQIPLTKLAELEKEVKDFAEHKLSTYKVANPTKRSDLLPKSIYALYVHGKTQNETNR